jgi:hypothetical protein
MVARSENELEDAVTDNMSPNNATRHGVPRDRVDGRGVHLLYCPMSSQTPISQPPQVPGSPPRRPLTRPNPDAVPPVETQIIDNQSSPVKPRKIPDKLDDIRDLPEAIDKSIDQNFTRDHLSDLTNPRQMWWSERCTALLETIRATKRGRETDMYMPLCELLTCISEGIYCKLFYFLSKPAF